MTPKLNLRCTGWKQICKGSLRGFAVIEIAELRMTMREVAVHESHGKTWAQPPARPWLKDGVAVRGDDGKIQYSPVFEFGSPGVRQAFSNAAVAAVVAAYPDALTCNEDTAA